MSSAIHQPRADARMIGRFYQTHASISHSCDLRAILAKFSYRQFVADLSTSHFIENFLSSLHDDDVICFT